MVPDLIRVAMVDDHISVLDSFQSAFSAENGFEVIAKVPSADDVYEICKEQIPDLVLMDVCTEGVASGLNALAELRPLYPDIKFILMSGFDEMSYVTRAQELGANAFVFKSKPLRYFLEVAKGVFEEKFYFPEPVEIPVAEGESPYTKRELQILRLVCQNVSRAEIAKTLEISEHTVNRHIEKMRSKGGYSSVFEMAVKVVAKGWVTPDY